MKKAARGKDGADVERDIQQYADAFTARQQFIGATLNLSWRLALTVLIPLIGGISLDDKLNTSPMYTMLGMVLAAIFGCMAVWATVKEVNELQAEADATAKKLSVKEKK